MSSITYKVGLLFRSWEGCLSVEGREEGVSIDIKDNTDRDV